jgi:hypothetical protein
MIKKINPLQVSRLLKLRESGMGYQFIEANIGETPFKTKFLVINADLVIEDTSSLLTELRTIKIRSYHLMSKMAPIIDLQDIRLVESLTNYKSQSKHTGAIYQDKEKADGKEVFTRLSAFEDDMRIDAKSRKLLPGSFATTYDDYIYCKQNNCDPIARYALPNDEKIKWAFHIKPKEGDILQRGIVEPANNQPGGGEEAFFEDGTSDSTLLERTHY